MKKTELGAIICVCLTVVAIVFIMASCGEKYAEELTKRQKIAGTNVISNHDNYGLHP